MLTARKSEWFERLFAVYNRNLFRRRFDGLRVAGLESLRERDKNIPLVLYANHSSWWDGLAAFEIGRCARLDQFIMMEERQLRNLFLFRRLGAFSVVRESPRQAVESVNYAADLLRQKPNRALWIFPQGEILPNDARPLRFFNGTARVVEKTKKCCAAPVMMRYEFLANFKPAAFVRVGEPEIIESGASGKHLTASFVERATSLLEQTKTDILTGDLSAYQKIA